ncbi:hypothetical protein SMC26_40415 [Actinomadura fulvescens]|uniref:Uncharacterized protein n=1 Tax=Actinomadura fulvescens TaxID=46160 RepID=A0ABN3Q6Y7_9ACTN
MTTPNAPAFVDLDDLAPWVDSLRVVRAQLADLKAKEEQIVEHLKRSIGDAAEGRIGGRTVITYRRSRPGTRLDVDRLKAERPDIWEQYLVPKQPARPFVLDQAAA